MQEMKADEEDWEAKNNTKFIALVDFQRRINKEYEAEVWGMIGDVPDNLPPNKIKCEK